ncbi:MAG: DUF4249 family protein [Bacteroidales bacterium]|nr:DUF4249 family protein [Bacteroidales bacterium]
MKRAVVYILLIMLLTSCVKEADWSISENDSVYIVVDGIITNEYRVQYIYLNYNKTGLNDQPIPLSGADVIISNEDETYQLKEDPEEAGRYITDTIMVAKFNKNYSLLIFYQDRFYSAQANMVPGKTFAELRYKKNDNDDLYFIDYVASAFDADDPAMWEIDIDWSMVPGYDFQDPKSCRRKLIFYTLSTLDVSQVFAPIVEQVYFPAGTNITQRRYSLTSEHIDFLRSLLLETSWQGGVFPSDPANVITNLSDGAIGFFGICAVNSISLTVTEQKNINLNKGK